MFLNWGGGGLTRLQFPDSICKTAYNEAQDTCDDNKPVDTCDPDLQSELLTTKPPRGQQTALYEWAGKYI